MFSFLNKSKRNRQSSNSQPEDRGAALEIEVGYGNSLAQLQAEESDETTEEVSDNEDQQDDNNERPQCEYLASNAQQKSNALFILSKLGIEQSDADSIFYLYRLLTPTEAMYQTISEYVLNGQEHGYGIKVVNILRLVRNGEKEFHHIPHCKNENRMMLWHGTQTKRIAKILEEGFKLPDPKKQMFGPGIYFADRVSKSCNYCFDITKYPKPPVGSKAFLLLCDVLLGNSYNAKNPHTKLSKPPAGFRKTFHSVKCTGEKIPDKECQKFYNGSVVPCGPTVQNKRFPSYTVSFNEYTVYSTDKIRVQFLVEVEFMANPILNDISVSDGGAGTNEQ